MAKDLAILAREIHDVAGDGDPQNVESSAPISTVTAHEQVHCMVVVVVVVDSLFFSSLSQTSLLKRKCLSVFLLQVLVNYIVLLHYIAVS